MDLAQATEDLRAREPIFHQPEFGTTRADFDRMMASDFFEIGASGKRYSRTFILDTLEERHRTPQMEDLVVSEFAVRQLDEQLYQATYLLLQPPDRYTQRSTLWRYDSGAWKIVFHQGTLMQH
ncbi:MAG: DUF4440 domain-containing protein [Acidobacteria bacterium]|nr:DUF4440 domain-containing protein [Acidobacteriota bacterium]